MNSCIFEIFNYVGNSTKPIASHVITYNGESASYTFEDATGRYYYRLPTMVDPNFSLGAFKKMLEQWFTNEEYAGINRIVTPIIQSWNDTIAYDRHNRIFIKIGNFITAKDSVKKSTAK